MNLVTYNLRSGGTGRVHRSRVIEAFRPDIFLVHSTEEPSRREYDSQVVPLNAWLLPNLSVFLASRPSRPGTTSFSHGALER